MLFLLGLPGVARTSQLDARQVTPSGNSSVILPSLSSSLDSSSSSSQTESTAPSLVAISTTTSSATSAEVTTSSSLSKQERGPQDPDVTPPGPPPALVPTIVTSPAEATPLGETPVSPATTSTSIIIESTTGTTTLAFSSPTTIIASPGISSAQPTTIATTNTNSPVASPPPATLITSKITPSVISSSTPSSEASGIVTTTSSCESTSSPTATVTMPSPTPTPSSVSSSTDGNGTSTLTIALSTILSVTGVVLIAVAAYLCTGDRRKKLPMFRIKRGITPIGDDEIATWKSNRSAEKVTDRYTTRPSHSQNPSTATSTRRAPSVIQYHNGGRQSFEVASPRSFIGDGGKYSFDLPQAPGAVLARAPNARSGLTDEAVPGDDPFLPSPKRNPSRLHKLPPNSPSLHGRTKGSRSSSLRSYAEAAWRDGLEQNSSPRVSSDAHTRNHNRIYSNSSIPPPPRLSFGDNDQLTGLSPPPSRRNDSTIGLAVG
ncbi:uncharacterized protein F4807DRAFT_468104 [Annulohypoxylon truncatum]|uniref:uncharacterized protein n=1 Tax=Annulohypoxylon truncatum TaxID=327061 RepID=UPI0020082DD8|nr:uncharacterized protein F4807DRAFT_468104 [Annulohypoxylon truncatum]KAI1214149.1 hypothetical protein F4807DRAFT_468104 [Annulohypoxylon truncatum]